MFLRIKPTAFRRFHDLPGRFLLRPALLIVLAAGVFIGRCPVVAVEAAEKPRTPNIVFILADDK